MMWVHPFAWSTSQVLKLNRQHLFCNAIKMLGSAFGSLNYMHKVKSEAHGNELSDFHQRHFKPTPYPAPNDEQMNLGTTCGADEV